MPVCEGTVRKIVEGGIYITQGERRPDQPFRVCVHRSTDAARMSKDWTSYPDEAITLFLLALNRIRKIRKPIMVEIYKDILRPHLY